MRWAWYRCIVCLQSADKEDLCGYCNDALPWVNQQKTCFICQQPLAHQAACGRCQKRLPEWSGMVAAMYFTPYSKWLIHHFKYQENLAYGRLLARSMLPAIKMRYQAQPWPEAILPVPLHYRRLMKRGFNQSSVLAQYIAKSLKIKLDQQMLKRIKSTQAQALLKPVARKKNVEKAFIAKPRAYLHVAVIDDVLTTGSTLKVIIKALKEVGVKQVDVWCVAVALR